MGCRFCASTIGGKVRDLLASEMLGQIYAVERLNIFGEDRNAQVWGIEDENRDYEKLHEMFCRYNCVKFAQIGDMPYLLNGIMNGDEKKLSHK